MVSYGWSIVPVRTAVYQHQVGKGCKDILSLTLGKLTGLYWLSDLHVWLCSIPLWVCPGWCWSVCAVTMVTANHVEYTKHLSA